MYQTVTISTDKERPVENWRSTDYFPALWVLKRHIQIEVETIKFIRRTSNITTALVNGVIEVIISDMTPGAGHRRCGDIY